MIVVIGGPPGGGKTTVAERFARSYGFVLVSGGRIFRAMAEERGMDVLAFGEHAEANHDVDRELDARVLSAVRDAGDRDVVVDGRIQVHLLPRAGLPVFAVHVTAPPQVRAQRLARREGIAEEEALREIRAREASERARYRAIYGIDLDDTSAFDLTLDSARATPEELAARIHEGAKAWRP